MGKRRYMEKMKGTEILFSIIPPLCIFCTIESSQSIKEIIILGTFLIFVELTTRELDLKRGFTEEHIVLAVLKVMSFFMIYVVLTGDRVLSLLGFIVFASYLYFLLYLYAVRNRKIPPKLVQATPITAHLSN